MKHNIHNASDGEKSVMWFIGIMNGFIQEGLVQGGEFKLTDEGRELFHHLIETDYKPKLENIQECINYFCGENKEDIENIFQLIEFYYPELWK